MFQKAIDDYNSKRSKDRHVDKKTIILKLVSMKLIPSYNYGLKMFNKIDSGEQIRINPEIEFRLAKIFRISMDQFFTYYNFK